MNKLIDKFYYRFFFADNGLLLLVKFILDLIGIGFLFWSVYLGGLDKAPTWTLAYLAVIGMIDFMVQLNRGIVWRYVLDGAFFVMVAYSLFTK